MAVKIKLSARQVEFLRARAGDGRFYASRSPECRTGRALQKRGLVIYLYGHNHWGLTLAGVEYLQDTGLIGGGSCQ